MSFLGDSWDVFANQFGSNFESLGQDTNISIKDKIDDWEDWTIHWSAFDNNVTSAYQNINDLRRELSVMQADTLSAQNLLLDPIDNATKDAKNTLSTVVKVLDTLAGNNTDATAADKMLSSVVNVCNALTACIAPVTKLGFPEIPILGDIGKFLEMLMQKDKIYRMLPPEVRQQVEDKMKAEKADKNSDQWFSYLLKKFKDSDWADLLYAGWMDIVKIMANLPFLPITILCAAVSVLVDAVSQLFNVVGLGAFNFDSLIAGKGLNFNLNIQDPGFSFDPPGNILEALAKCIPLILNSIVTLPQMLINGIMENLYLICGGIKSIASPAIWDNPSRNFLISAINDTILSNELFIENNNLSEQIMAIESTKKNVEEEIQNYYKQLSETGNYDAINPLINNAETRKIDLDENIQDLKKVIEKNQETMKTLIKYDPNAKKQTTTSNTGETASQK